MPVHPTILTHVRFSDAPYPAACAKHGYCRSVLCLSFPLLFFVICSREGRNRVCDWYNGRFRCCIDLSTEKATTSQRSVPLVVESWYYSRGGNPPPRKENAFGNPEGLLETSVLKNKTFFFCRLKPVYGMPIETG